jgi:hypothetical protein
MYPALKGIEERYGPTKVHLQVYDGAHTLTPWPLPATHLRLEDCPHVLPILFSFTQPAKFGYRAMATFIRHVTGLPTVRPANSLGSDVPANGPGFHLRTAPARRHNSLLGILRRTASVADTPSVPEDQEEAADRAASPPRPEARRASSLNVTDAARKVLRHASFRKRPDMPTRVSEASESERSPQTVLSGPLVTTPDSSPQIVQSPPADGFSFPTVPPAPSPTRERMSLSPPPRPVAGPSRRSWGTPPSSPRSPRTPSPAAKPSDGSDVAGPRFEPGSVHTEARQAGDPSIYEDSEVGVIHVLYVWSSLTVHVQNPWVGMIRERVSTQGIIRPLEPPAELAAMTVPADMIGVVSELAARRYIDGRTKYDHKFRREIKAIHRAREKQLAAARRDATKKKNMAQLQAALFQDSDGLAYAGPSALADGLAAVTASSSWTWAWALDEERPPPSSIVARRDTQEARALAQIADSSESASAMSGNNLWSILMTFLTLGPDNSKGAGAGDRLRGVENEATSVDKSGDKPARSQSKSRRLKEKLSLTFQKSKV